MPSVCRHWLLVPLIFLLTSSPCGGMPDLSSRQQDVLGALLDGWERGGGGGWIPSREATAAMESFQARQTASLGRLGEDKFILLHMNPGAGLGNRLVAVVSGFLLAQVTGRALLTDWEAYSDERTHRSREVSTMTGLSAFISPKVTIDAGDAMQSDSARASFGWDFSQWGRVSDEDVAAMAAVRDGDFNRLYPQRVVIVDAISYFGRLLSENPLYSPGLTKSFGSNPFPAAASMILKPSATPASLAGGYYLQKFAGSRIVAVHLRTIEYMSPEEVDTALRCAQFLAGGGGIFVASDTSAGMRAASTILGEGEFHSYATVEPGRSGGDALLDGWVNLLLMSRADAIVGKARSSYALLAAGMSGGAAAGRPFYEVGKGSTCTRVTCDMLPGIQQDHPAAKLVDEGGCFSKGPSVTLSRLE